MKPLPMKKVAFIFIILTMSTFASFAKGPFYVDLVDKNFVSPHKISCWHSDGTFNSVQCDKTPEACEIQGKLPSLELVKVTIVNSNFIKSRNSSSSFRTYVEELDLQDYVSLYGGERINLENKFFPVGSKFHLYTDSGHGSDPRTITIYKQATINESGELTNVAPLPATNQFVITLPDVLPPGHRYFVKILGEHFNLSPVEREIKLSLSAGTYPIKIMKTFSGAYEELRINLKVIHSDLLTQKALNIKNESFVPISNSNENRYLSWKSEGYPPQKYLPEIVMNSREISKAMFIENIEALEVKELKNQDMSEYFEIKFGHPVLKKDKETEFISMIKSFPLLNVKLKATCLAVSPKAQIKNYSVYKEANSKDFLGIIEATYSSEQKVSKKFKKNSSNQEESFNFHAPVYDCGEDGQFSGIFSRSSKNGYVSLGPGPWGKNGWIEARAQDVFNSSIQFEYQDMNEVSFKDEKGVYKAIGVDTKHEKYQYLEPGDDTSAMKKTIVVDPEKFWDREGRFIPNIDCGRGC